jgi:anhydro-N-acetylmuramic acid kinase
MKERAGPARARRRDVFVGLMSGTSLDGITAAVARFGSASAAPGDYNGCDLLGLVTRPYGRLERERLERAMKMAIPPSEWCQLGFDLGGWLADAAVTVLADSGVSRSEVGAIGSHGHTVWHVPPRSTCQIGEAAVIAERTGLDVVSDFRVGDVAAGGQGAPLVSMADGVLFAPATGWRALQNLGGIGNVSVVAGPNGPRARGACVRAFDTGPGVVIIDAVSRVLRPDLPYDVDGQLSRDGSVIHEVVEAVVRDPYFAEPPPKSTGREHFSSDYTSEFIARCRHLRPGASDADLVATAVWLTARTVADAYARFVPEPVTEVLLSGGGARHPGLVDALTRALAPREVRQFASVYFDGEAKEAVAFALLAALNLTGQPGNVPAATGAKGPRVLGKLTRGVRAASAQPTSSVNARGAARKRSPRPRRR